MTEVKLQDAIDEAVLVRVNETVAGTTVQVWYGGTQVRVFAAESCCAGPWTELTVWTLADEKGRPANRAKVAEHMEMHFDAMEDYDS